MGLAVASILVFASVPRSACSKEVRESRTVVFDNEVARDYPKFNRSWNDDMVELDMFYMSPYKPAISPRHHLPGSLVLAYDACDVRPWGTPRLDWYLGPRTGLGSSSIGKPG